MTKGDMKFDKYKFNKIMNGAAKCGIAFKTMHNGRYPIASDFKAAEAQRLSDNVMVKTLEVCNCIAVKMPCHTDGAQWEDEYMELIGAFLSTGPSHVIGLKDGVAEWLIWDDTCFVVRERECA